MRRRWQGNQGNTAATSSLQSALLVGMSASAALEVEFGQRKGGQGGERQDVCKGRRAGRLGWMVCTTFRGRAQARITTLPRTTTRSGRNRNVILTGPHDGGDDACGGSGGRGRETISQGSLQASADDRSTAAATQRICLNPIPPAPTANVSSDRTSHVSLELQRREVEVQCLSSSDAAPESSRLRLLSGSQLSGLHAKEQATATLVPQARLAWKWSLRKAGMVCTTPCRSARQCRPGHGTRLRQRGSWNEQDPVQACTGNGSSHQLCHTAISQKAQLRAAHTNAGHQC